MKADRFTSDYDKIRKRAGLAKPNYEFPDEQAEKFEADALYTRVQAALEDFHSRMNVREEHLTQKDLEARAAMDALRQRGTERMIRFEYERLGLTPPEPLVSLDLLLMIGWRIESATMMGEERYFLVEPVHGKASAARAESDQNT